MPDQCTEAILVWKYERPLARIQAKKHYGSDTKGMPITGDQQSQIQVVWKSDGCQGCNHHCCTRA